VLEGLSMRDGVDAAVPPPLVGGGNLSTLLGRAAQAWGERCALVHDGGELTYAQLEERSRQAAALLADLGVQPGDRVGLQLPNSPAFVTLYFALLRLGAIVVPQNPLAPAEEVDRNFDDAGARIVLTLRSDRDGAARRVAVDDAELDRLLDQREPHDAVHAVAPDDTAVILYTSGTTGRPKGAELTHANLLRNAQAAVEIYGYGTDDVVLAALPLYHSYGQTCTLNGPFAVGARVILAARFEARRAAELIRDHGVTVLLGVPTMFSDLAHADVPSTAFASLRMASSGGAPLPPQVLERFEARAQTTLYETYGLSETSPIASFNALRGLHRPGTVGWPIDGTEMKIVGDEEIGEIAIRGHNIMKGYWGNPQATREAIDADGWFHSGDLGTMDADGCFRVVGRIKDLIIRGGHNVYPREIEDLLYRHPAVRAAAVVGVPDDRLGEEIGAAVVLEPEATATPSELREWVRPRVAPHKYPRHIWIVDELPTGPTGKILKRAISPPTGLGGGDVSAR
jgi:long-chain acyl-CoA synthetase